MSHCLIAQQSDLVMQISLETKQALRSFRQSLLNCEFCPAFEYCELREQFNNKVNRVISEINEEWGW